MSLRRKPLVTCFAFFVALPWAASILAADGKQGDADLARQQAVTKAIDYLRQKGQADDGSFSRQTGPAVTALIATALLRNGLAVKDPMIEKSLKYIEQFVKDNGGIYHEKSTHQNYETCVAILAFSEANRDGRYDELLKKADAYVKGIQWDEQEGQDESSFSYGGAGYGGKKRPDLSNTSFFIDALKAAGDGPDDEAMKKALIFVSRCQNLETEHNTTPFASKNPDGGFYYTAAAGGESFAGQVDGGLRSYGSMTYAGLKSMIFAGVGPEDPRVKAAVEWVRKNYSLDANPGMGDAGLYYYYHTFAKALDALGEDELTDADGAKHDWRRELAAELASRQQADGSWSNSNSRWMEGDPNLVTGYALLALSYCRHPQPARR
ncbi:MAG TPA: prenyltransferase/squalene oxidase repeat-containing protein [Pirellulales bacterium]|nr:prenyltransferase/squalene oxidase repeat-containing protein [Pirellulales bacterium]